MDKTVLKGSRWILPKNPENLCRERNEPDRLREALQLNEPLATAYYLKEDLRQIWIHPCKADAARFLEGWIERATGSGIAPLARVLKTLAAYRSGLLAWYDHTISSGPHGRHQQQDQDHETPSLRLPRHGLLQAQ